MAEGKHSKKFVSHTTQVDLQEDSVAGGQTTLLHVRK